MQRKCVLTLNAGSSSLKCAAFEISNGALGQEVFKAQISGLPGNAVFNDAKNSVVKALPYTDDVNDAYVMAATYLFEKVRKELAVFEFSVVGHRIVHGGTEFKEAVRMTPEIFEALVRLNPLAPRHQPHNLAGVKIATAQFPGTSQVACFDTAFHREIKFDAYGLPRKYLDEGIHRFGFHGLSYEYVFGQFINMTETRVAERVIIAHLGAGASMCAILNGKSIATTMGFSTLEGLPMATRIGSIDPGVILYLLEQKNMSAAEISECLYNQSGLLGISGESADMKVLLESDKPEAREAVSYFVESAVREIGKLAAALQGLDAIIFTGGIGENSVEIRKIIIEKCAWLGFELNHAVNETGGPLISDKGHEKSVWAISTSEERMIAIHAIEKVGVAH